MREEASVWPAKPGRAVEVAVFANDNGAQWTRSVFVVSIRIPGAERVQNCELTRGGDFEDCAASVQAAESGHSVKHAIGSTRQRDARRGSVLVVSICIQRAEGMQDRVLMRVPVEAVDDAVAILAADSGHPINGVIRTQRRP